jgi:hypothetical protein
MKMKIIMIGTVSLILAVMGMTLANGQTAFALVRAGDRYVGDQSKDRVVQIRSERSTGTLTPDIWYIDYYDPDATLKAVEVKFGAGQKMDVSHPLRLLEPITGADRMLDPSRLKIDSDQALSIARAQPFLANLTLSGTQLWLQHGEEGPRWKIKFWAAKTGYPSHEADVGDVYVSAADGSVLRADLHPESLN